MLIPTTTYARPTAVSASLTLASGTAVGASSFSLSAAPPWVPNEGWMVIDPYTSSCEVLRPTAVNGQAVTVASHTVTASNIGFVAATKRITGAAESISQFFPGETITVTGSASNNGVFTVAAYPSDGSYDGTYITVSETVVDESAGASVTVRRNTKAHSSGATVWFTEGPISVTWYGARASGSEADATTTRAAIQRCLNDSYYASFNDVYFPGFLAGRYVVDGPLYLEKLTHIRGPNHKSAVIAAASTFPTWDSNVAILTSRRNGMVCRAQTGGNDRYYVSGMGIDGLNVAYAKSTGYDGSDAAGTGYVQSGTKTFSIHATYTSEGQGVTYRALAGGTGGNAIRVAHVNNGPSLGLSVSVAGNDITVQLATNGSSVVTSTLNDVIAAVNAHGTANTMVQASLFKGYDLGVSGFGGTNLAQTFALTALRAGTAPFAAGDVGRSLDICTGGVSRGAGEGARTITGFTNAYTVTVDGNNFLKSYAGMRFAVSGINGTLFACNQTCRFDDMRVESCPGYAVGFTGSQEFSVRNLMTLFSGIHIRLFDGNQFAHFIDVNMEHTGDAYVSFEDSLTGGINRSNHFIGGHIEDISMCDYFRANTPSTKFSNFQVYEFQSTSNAWTTVMYVNTVSSPSEYGFIGWEWSGPNSGPMFLNDDDRSLDMNMTDFTGGDTFYVAHWVSAGGGETITPRWVRSKSGTYQMLVTDKLVKADATGGAFTVTLPSAVGIDGMAFTVKRMNSGANAVSVDQTGSETIDGSTTAVSLAAQYDRITVMSDGANWMRVD